MAKEAARKLTRDEKFAIQRSGRFWKDWMYLKAPKFKAGKALKDAVN